MARNERALRRRECSGRARELLGSDRTFNGVLESLEADRGRRIRLLPVNFGVSVPCGLLLATDAVDIICYPEDTTPLHRNHIISHEIGHILYDHQETHVASLDRSAELTALRALMPDLDPDEVRGVLGRTVYDDDQEWVAETFATVMMTMLSTPGAHRGRGGDALASLFGGWRR